VTDGVIRTPTDRSILQGVSRIDILALAKGLGIPVSEEDLQPYDAYNADEVFMAGTSHSMLPISRVDWRPLRGECPGPVFKQIMAAWSEIVGMDIVGQAHAMSNVLPE
jgi:branched-subunit amino acid aminotransferase/4-amino-4-deoxychorismate lyase